MIKGKWTIYKFRRSTFKRYNIINVLFVQLYLMLIFFKGGNKTDTEIVDFISNSIDPENQVRAFFY